MPPPHHRFPGAVEPPSTSVPRRPARPACSGRRGRQANGLRCSAESPATSAREGTDRAGADHTFPDAMPSFSPPRFSPESSVSCSTRLTQTGKYPATGDIDRPYRKPKLCRYRCDRPVLDAGPPKGLPGGIRELILDLIRRPGNARRLNSAWNSASAWVSSSRLRLQQLLHPGAAAAADGRDARLARKFTSRFRAMRKSQPRNFPLAGSGSQALDRSGYRAEDFLA